MSSKQKLRIGVLGGGGILRAHCKGYRAFTDLAEVTAVAEPVTSRHAGIEKLIGHPVRFFDDYRTLLEQADVDAVDIILPHQLHMPATVAAAKSGKHVLVEKVMARNVHECDQMIDACKENKVTLTVCHDRRYHDEWLALKHVLDAGAIGKPLYWRLDHNQDFNPSIRHTWGANWNGIGGGAIMSCLTHQIDALRWYGGEVQEVSCMTQVVPERMQGESAGVLIAKLNSGALAHLSINWLTRSNRVKNGLWYEMVHVCGTEGEAYYHSGKGTYLLRQDGDYKAFDGLLGPTQEEDGFMVVQGGKVSGHERCIREWAKLVRGESNEVTTGGREGRGTVEVAEAGYRAEEAGVTVSLPIEPKPWVDRPEPTFASLAAT